MSNKFEKKAFEVWIEISKKETSFEKASELYFKNLKEVVSAEKEEITDELGETMANIFVMFVGKNRDFTEKWIDGEISPSDDQLNLLESNCEEVLEIIDKINQKVPQIVDDGYCLKTKEGVKKLKQKVQQEKEGRRQQPNNPTTSLNNNTSSNNQQTSQLQNQLNQLSQQIQSLLNNQKQNPTDSSNNNQFQQIQEKLNSLQNQIQSLENEPKDSPNAPTSQSDKQELTKLKKQIQQLQKDLKSKQTGDKKDTNSQSSEKGFNWLYIVIPGGILLVLAGIVIAYLAGKKNKKE